MLLVALVQHKGDILSHKCVDERSMPIAQRQTHQRGVNRMLVEQREGLAAGCCDGHRNASGLVDPLSGSPESWTTGESHVYRLDVTLQSNFAAQSKTAAQVFRWEARNQ